jgi:hypothetical protein
VIYTFWEGDMPEYLKLCLETWKFPFVILTYDNLHQYTDAKVTDKLRQRTLPKVGDWVRVHVLRDSGGYWLDTDTIMLTDNLPSDPLIGNNDERMTSVGFLYASKTHEELFEKWAEYQDSVLAKIPDMYQDFTQWSLLGNDFVDPYLKEHKEIHIADIEKCWPETYMIDGAIERRIKYQKFYFGNSFKINDILKSDMLMLHNSWTPIWYKNLSRQDILNFDCTMSNILKEVI